MGNNLRFSLGNTGSPRFRPFHLELGGSAAIDFSKTVSKKDDDGQHTESWLVSYTVERKTCDIFLKKFVAQDNNVNLVIFGLDDKVYFECCNFNIVIQRTETSFLRIYSRRCACFESLTSEKMNKTIDAWGRVTDTTVRLYGNENKGGLIVQEEKKNSRDEDPNTLTVTHYFVNRKGIAFNATEETGVGLSMVAKFRVSDGKLDITVEGPEQHPASALVFMFHEVNRTGVWKPTMCPHCSNNRRQFSRMLFSQSDSEDSDSVPLAPRPGRQQNARRIANDGRFVGDGNGNFIENNVMVFRRRWWD